VWLAATYHSLDPEIAEGSVVCQPEWAILPGLSAGFVDHSYSVLGCHIDEQSWRNPVQSKRLQPVCVELYIADFL
jgi:hypothetical protein